MNSVLITGCSRGIGLGLVKSFLKLNPSHIFATVRNIDQAQELKDIAEKNSNVHILKIDIRNFDQYDRLTAEIGDIVKEKGLNILFNNAAISPKSTRLLFVKPEQLLDTFTVNTLAPIMLTKAFVPLLKKAAHFNSAEPNGAKKALIVNMSSSLGSIQSNVEGGLYPYRVTKTGLNAATKSMSIDLKGNDIMAISMHPGWVKTDMGGDKAPMSVEKSCDKMIETLMKLTNQQNGCFLQYSGKELPW